MIVPEFYATVDAEKKYDEVVREINALRPTLPAEIAPLEIQKSNPGLVNIVQFALVSRGRAVSRAGRSRARSERHAQDASTACARRETWAYPARELRVALDLPRMAELKLAPGKVMQALQSENTNIPGGSIDVGSRSFSVKTSGSYESLDEVRDTVVAAADGRTVRVRDIAEVSWDTQEHTLPRPLQRPARGVRDRESERRLQHLRRARAHRRRREELRDAAAEAHPAGARLRSVGERRATPRPARRRDFAIAIALVAITLLPLGLRAAGVVMISIPLSLAIGLSTLHFLGFSLNQISIAGFVVALGLLVDDSIVVVENIARFLREGHSRTQAAILATRQIFLAIARLHRHDHVRVPAADDARRRRRASSSACCRLPCSSTVGASLLVALTIIPFLASRMLQANTKTRTAIACCSGSPAASIASTSRCCTGRWRSPKLTVWASLAALLVVIVGVGGAHRLQPVPEGGHAALPGHGRNAGRQQPGGDRSRAALRREHAAAAMPRGRVVLHQSRPRQPEDLLQRDPATRATAATATCSSSSRATTRTTRRECSTSCAREFEDYPNARIYVQEFQNGPPINAPIAIRVIGPDLDELHRARRARSSRSMRANAGHARRRESRAHARAPT